LPPHLLFAWWRFSTIRWGLEEASDPASQARDFQIVLAPGLFREHAHTSIAGTPELAHRCDNRNRPRNTLVSQQS